MNNPHDATDVHRQLNNRVPLILDGGRCPGGIPSTVVDCTTDKVSILREGTISQLEIEEALNAPLD